MAQAAQRLTAALALVAAVASAAPADAVWGHSSGADAGRSAQSGASGPRHAPTAPVGYNHLVHVAWRFLLPGDASSSFYYGAIDSAGDVFYLVTGTGGAPHVVRKLRGGSGELLWASTPPPRPEYANYYGSDHLLAWRDVSVYVIAGTTYTLPDCAWVQALDATTGQQTWLLSGLNTVANALVSADGAALFLSFYNGTVARLRAATGALEASWDLARAGVLSNASIALDMALSRVSNALLFSSIGNYSAVSATDGRVLWHVGDPVNGEFASRPATPASGAFAKFLFTASGGNYQQGAGQASLALADGSTAWDVPTTSIISAVNGVARQGWQFVVSTPGSGTTNTVSVVSLATGNLLAPSAYFSSFAFTSNPAVSADGLCLYVFGSNRISDTTRTSLASFCYSPTAQTLSTEFSATISGINSPSRYGLAVGPGDGQVSIFHDSGVAVIEAFVLRPAPPRPAPTAGSGESFALVFGKSTATCLTGGGSVTIWPAALTRATPTSAPTWLLGAASSGVVAEGNCGSTMPPAVDIKGRRAWILFSCLPPGGGKSQTLLAQLDLGLARGAVPSVARLCTWPLARAAPLHFDARVGLFFLDSGAPSVRPFYTVVVPAAPPSSPAPAAPPQCVLTKVGELHGVLLPAASLQTADAAGASTLLYAAASTLYGVRIIGMRVPNGTIALDLTLPCDTGLCFDGARFLAVRNGSAVVGGFASSSPDWPLSTLAQAADLRPSSPRPTTLTGLVSRQAPTFPLLPAGSVAALADPRGASVTWLQSLALGSTACTAHDGAAVLQSVAVVGTRAQDTVLVANTTVSACPLPDGTLCFGIVVGHVEAFTEQG